MQVSAHSFWFLPLRNIFFLCVIKTEVILDSL